MITDPDEIKAQLLKWASEYSNVEITEFSLSLGDVSIDAKGKLNNGYSAASVFLQVRDPEIALMRYRNACKQYKVDDPIKVSDKPRIVAEFASSSSTVAPEAAPPATEDSSTKKPTPPPPKDKEKRKSSGKRPAPPSDSKKQPRKKPDMVTTEQLFASLNGVVDKRSTGMSKIEAAITTALSSEGFEVTTPVDEATKKRAESIMKKEIPVGNSASILRSNDPRKDLKRVLELYKEAVMVQPAEASSKTASAQKSKVRAHLMGQKPVIVVPKGMTAPLTLLNAHAFLSESTFVPRDQIKSRNNTSTKFTRTIFGNPLEYDITDNPSRFFDGGTKDWDRIVAVIVLGQDWQFKDWIPGFNAPATLFERVFGYYIGDDPPVQWAIKRGQLQRDKRGLDSITYTSFWTQLDEWMRVHKPELIPRKIGVE